MPDKRKGKSKSELGPIVQRPVAQFDPGSADYAGWLDDLKGLIKTSRVKAALAVNRELLLLYWRIGRQILEQQERLGWGAKVIDQLGADLSREFPEMKGLSARNLKYMRALAAAYPDAEIVQQVVAQIPWGHNISLLEKLEDPAVRIWYAQQTVQHGWSRNVLVHQIETRLFERQGKAVTNFETALPAPQSDLAQALLKDPYTFDFLTLAPEAKERDLERSLLQHLRDFLIELGQGFAFVGSQYHLEVGGEDFYLDLLFYHLKLRCYVVIDLKMGSFQPEYAGKMNFYLSAVDDQLRHPADQPSIGLILCKERNRLIVEYALRDTRKPMGVAEYQLLDHLPEQLKGAIPTQSDLQAEMHSQVSTSAQGDLQP